MLYAVVLSDGELQCIPDQESGPEHFGLAIFDPHGSEPEAFEPTPWQAVPGEEGVLSSFRLPTSLAGRISMKGWKADLNQDGIPDYVLSFVPLRRGPYLPWYDQVYFVSDPEGHRVAFTQSLKTMPKCFTYVGEHGEFLVAQYGAGPCPHSPVNSGVERLRVNLLVYRDGAFHLANHLNSAFPIYACNPRPQRESDIASEIPDNSRFTRPVLAE